MAHSDSEVGSRSRGDKPGASGGASSSLGPHALGSVGDRRGGHQLTYLRPRSCRVGEGDGEALRSSARGQSPLTARRWHAPWE